MNRPPDRIRFTPVFPWCLILVLASTAWALPVSDFTDPYDIQYIRIQSEDKILFQERGLSTVQWADNLDLSDLRTHWYLESVPGSTTYFIRNRVTGDSMHVESQNGRAEIQSHRPSEPSHRWELEAEATFFRIKSGWQADQYLSTEIESDPDLRVIPLDTGQGGQRFVFEKVPIGATVPWTTYDEENTASLTGGAVVENTLWDQESMVVEAQKGGAIRLASVGAEVTWTATGSADCLTLRYAVPDGQSGNLRLTITGSTSQSLNIPVTSSQAWIYFEGGKEYNSYRTGRLPARRYNEARIKLSSPIASGDTIRLVREGGGPEIWIDLLEAEMADTYAPADPADYLDVTQAPYLAAGDGIADDTAALTNCLADALAAGKKVFLPEGRYRLTSEIELPDGAVLQGEGLWHTELFFSGSGSQSAGGIRADGDGIKLRDLYLVGSQQLRDSGYKAIKGRWGPGSAIINVWAEQMETGAWLDDFDTPIEATDGLRIFNCRFRNAFADGINFAGGSRNGVVDNCHLRGNGDDGIATWASGVDRGLATTQNQRIRYNTVECTYRAAGIAIHGGNGHIVQRNLVRDQSIGAGIRFTSIFEYLGSTHVGYGYGTGADMRVYGNSLHRTGNLTLFGEEVGAIDFNLQYSDITRIILEDNTVATSRYSGVRFSGLAAAGNQVFSNISLRRLSISDAPVGTRVMGQAAGSVDYTQVNLLTSGQEYEFLTSALAINLVGAGIDVAATGSGTAVTEGGVTDSYTLTLTAVPAADVTLSILSDGQLEASPESVTFTPGNWSTPRSITVTAVDDPDIEGFHSGTLAHQATSSDPAYDQLTVAPVDVSITDNDVNNPPVVSLSTPTYVALSSGNGLVLEGEVSDDGPGLSTTWVQVEGPAGESAQFDDASSITTGVTFTGSGDYLLRFTADDGEYAETGQVIVYYDSPFPGAYIGGQDIGGVAAAGSSSASTGVYTVRGSGSDIWETYDEFHFFNAPFTGDGSITIRLLSQTNTDPWAKVGVMIRDTLSPDSTHAFLAVTPGNGVACQTRLATRNISTHDPAQASFTFPIWLRLTRSGSVITASTSDDGETYTIAGTYSPPMSGSDYMGIAITSHNNGVLSEAVFDSLSTSLGNRAPSVSAGSPLTIQAHRPETISGSVTDDGVPEDPGTVSPLWQLVSGPGTVSLDSPGSPSTPIEVDAAGEYLLRLYADDGELTSFSQVTLTADELDIPAMQAWQTYFFTDPDSSQAAAMADPNGDLQPNYRHFALDSDPTTGRGVSDKVRSGMVESSGDDHFSITIPVRRNAVFSGSPLESAPIDGLVYRILADDDLQGADLSVVETPTPQPHTLPALGDYDDNGQADYEYRTFRLTPSITAQDRAFIQVVIEPE
jgi:hypothetical protein